MKRRTATLLAAAALAALLIFPHRARAAALVSSADSEGDDDSDVDTGGKDDSSASGNSKDDDDDEKHDTGKDGKRGSAHGGDRDFKYNFNYNYHNSDDDDDEDDGKPDAKSVGDTSMAKLAVTGPVQLRIGAQSGEIEIVGGDKPEVTAKLSGTHSSKVITLVRRGDRIEVQFGDHRQLRRGHLRIEVPRSTVVEANSMSADISAEGVTGEVRIRTLSGEIRASQVSAAELETVSGDVQVENVKGRLRVHTVSGDAIVASTQPAGQIQFESTSGGLKWSGACAKDCHLSAETVSGDVHFALDPKSSFELSFGSHSGDVHDELGLEVRHKLRHKPSFGGGWSEAVYGKGEGVIECDTFSGDVELDKK